MFDKEKAQQDMFDDATNKQKCISCGKHATKLCDIVTGHIVACGGTMQSWNTTCDNPICDKCSIHLNEYMDICPDCLKEIKVKSIL